MTSMGVRPVHTVLTLLFITTLKADEDLKGGHVTFWMEHVTMTCPANGTWHKRNGQELGGTQKEYTQKYDSDMKGLYYCKSSLGKYYFYVQGKVCPNCFELDAKFLALAIIMDLLLTASLMVIIYRYTKKKTSDKLSHTSNAGRRQPTESPEYEQLSPHTLSQGTYSVVNRMG